MERNQSQSSNLEEKLSREQILRVLELGRNSKYWKLIEERVQAWIDKENKFLEGFKRTGITEKNRHEYNRVVDQIYFMERFLTINDILADENKTILERLKEKVEDYSGNLKSFFSLNS